jgi:hypothetical protein
MTGDLLRIVAGIVDAGSLKTLTRSAKGGSDSPKTVANESPKTQIRKAAKPRSCCERVEDNAFHLRRQSNQQKEPGAIERAIHLMGETFYAKRNFPVLRVADRRHVLRVHERAFGQSAGTFADAAGGYRHLRTGRREGGAERGDSVHYPDGVSDDGAVSIFR